MRALAGLLLLVAACEPSPRLEDAGVTVDAGVVTLAFEPITLEGTPRAVTNLVAVPGTESDFVMLEKTGTIHHYVVSGTSATLRATVTVPGVDTTADCGLVSLAFDPDYATNRFVFVGSCVSPTHSRITRHVYDPEDTSSFASSGVTILTVGDPDSVNAWHNVGSVGFEPSGVLWALFGEKDVGENAQDLTHELGALVRIVPSRTPGVGGSTPAPDNPFSLDADPLTNANVAAKGLRSPWKGTRDALGRIFIGDVGFTDVEELNVFVPTGVTANFAWPISEGRCESGCPPNAIQPIRHYTHSTSHPFALEDPEAPNTTRRVIWVGASYAPGETDRYEGALTDRLLYGDFCAGFVRGVTLDEHHQVASDRMLGHLVGVTGMAQGADGYLYVSTYGSCFAFPYERGSLYRVVPVVQ